MKVVADHNDLDPGRIECVWPRYSPMGMEIIIPRAIAAKEIHEIRSVPQVVGWRYVPGSNGRKMCGCPACLPAGTYNSRIFRQRFYDRLRRLAWLGISVPNPSSRRSSTG
jgi:hypothetical protein